MYCGICGNECEWKTEDIGYGVTDRGRDSELALVSDCCEGEVYKDEPLEHRLERAEYYEDWR